MASELRSALRIGLLGGLGAWHICLVGMLQTFAARRLIGDSITLGYVLLIALILLVSYVAARDARTRGRAIVLGLVAGGVVGLTLAALAVLVSTFNMRGMFVFATPQLVQLLTFNQGIGVGLLLPVLAGAGLGAGAGALAALPPLWRRTIVTALSVTVLIALLREVIASLLPGALAQVLFTDSGLTPVGAVVTLILGGAAVWVRPMVRQARTSNARVRTFGSSTFAERALLVVGAVVLLTFPLWGKLFLSNVADFVGLYIIMGLGLNLVVGFAGLLDLGYVAFFAIGAYTMAILTTADRGFGWGFWAALPVSILLALLAGVILGTPVLRMRGDYLALATLGFGEIIRILVLSDWLRPYLGGAQGITGIGRPTIGGFVFDTPEKFYYLVLAGVVVAWLIGSRLKTSRLGRAWMAIREDEDVAQAMGINRVTAKLTAFAIGAALGGLSGGLFASMVNSVVPGSFNLLISINVVAIIIVGGMGSLPGVVVGAHALVGLPELLREFQEYRLMVYGAILVAMMLFRPQGLWPEASVVRELVEAETLAREESDALQAMPSNELASASTVED